MVCQSLPCQMASPTPAPRRRGGLSINLEELESASKVLMFNPEENGPAGRSSKRGRRDDLFDANKFFSSQTTVQPMATLTPRRGPIANSPSGPIRSNPVLSFDLLPKFECNHKTSISPPIVPNFWTNCVYMLSEENLLFP